MKGLAVLVGDIGAGKTTLARRMLDSLPEDEYEAALLVIVHSGVTASWLLRRIALQLGVENPADEKLALLSQVYQRLVRIYESGKKAVVLIDEAQMLATRELMEDFYGRLLARQGRAEALRQAQLALKARYPEPFYWGAFICQGDPSPLGKVEPRED